MSPHDPTQSTPYDVHDLGLAEGGQRRIEWAAREMPVLASTRARFMRDRPLAGLRIAACLHVTTETANLVTTLAAGGAQLALCASNPLSTQDDVAAALVEIHDLQVFAINGVSQDGYYQHINAALDVKPHVTMDDGADLVTTLHQKRTELLGDVVGGTEETTTGVVRLRAMADHDALRYPIVAVNEALTKHLFDNRYGTGQSTIDGILRATNILLAGKVCVIAGYGWCSRGIARRAQGMGSNVIVTEVDPLRALEAVMDGFRVMPMRDAVKVGDIFVTATGDINVIDREHWALVKDGAIVCNSGHFNVELNLPALAEMAREVRHPRQHLAQYVLNDGRVIHVLAEGRLVNLAAAEGHPASVMDMSFANQALSVEYLHEHGSELDSKVYAVPDEIDREIARLKLAAMGVQIDTLTPEQEHYLHSWEEGT